MIGSHRITSSRVRSARIGCGTVCRHRTGLVLSLLLLVVGSAGTANELVYVPVNPSFGGNPNNGNWLSTNASAQNLTEDPNQPAPKNQLEQFKEQLQRAVLGRVASSVSGVLFDEVNRTWVEGTQTFGDFQISVTPFGTNQVEVVITDLVTGSTTSFTVDSQL